MKYLFLILSIVITLGFNLGIALNVNAQTHPFGTPTQFSNANTPFSSSLSYQGLFIEISSPNTNKGNAVLLKPKGLKGENAPVSVAIAGKVTGAEIADLNDDGFPEVYIYVNTSDVHANGSLVAFASNKNQSLTPIYMSPLSDDPVLMNGYIGHDEFAIVESSLERRFPLGKGGLHSYRQVQYKLQAGEAGWVLKKTRVTEF